MKMNVTNVKQHNSSQFVKDFKTATSIMMFAAETGQFFKIRKCDVLMWAEEQRILYRMTDSIYVRTRMIMVIY